MEATTPAPMTAGITHFGKPFSVTGSFVGSGETTAALTSSSEALQQEAIWSVRFTRTLSTTFRRTSWGKGGPVTRRRRHIAPFKKARLTFHTTNIQWSGISTWAAKQRIFYESRVYPIGRVFMFFLNNSTYTRVEFVCFFLVGQIKLTEMDFLTK